MDVSVSARVAPVASAPRAEYRCCRAEARTREHHWYCAQDLDINSVAIHIRKARLGVPAVRLDLAEELSVLHHAAVSSALDLRLVVVEGDPAAGVAKLFLEVWHLPRKDVRVKVHLQVLCNRSTTSSHSLIERLNRCHVPKHCDFR